MLRMHKKVEKLVAFVVLLFITAILIGCQKADTEGSIYDALGYVPTFTSSACQFNVPEGTNVECGYLTVPEDRNLPDGSTIRLHVAVFKSTSPDPALDPVIHLYGGPGGSLLDLVNYYLNVGGYDFLKTRDYVLFSQRGTRYAEPYLDCPGAVELMWEMSGRGLTYYERRMEEIDFYLACQEDLLDRGINLTTYNSTENAADVNDLRFVLGYEQVNLYGVSYGARLALAVMRDFPNAVRSAIIDSGYPMNIHINHEFALSAARAFDLIFEGCAADTTCDSRYPDLETTFYRVIDNLNNNPALVSLSRGEVYIDGDDIIDLTFGSLYTFYGPDGVSWIPQMITIADRGDLQDLASAFEVMFADSNFSEGMYYSVLCREEVPFDSYETARSLTADLQSQIQDHYVTPSMFNICDAWESGQIDPEKKEPVNSDIPALVLTGQYDPITPPSYNRIIAETLSNSFFYEIPGIGHGAMRGNKCALDIGLQFLDDPTSEPDASCLQQ